MMHATGLAPITYARRKQHSYFLFLQGSFLAASMYLAEEEQSLKLASPEAAKAECHGI